jgi:short-subunit dehydrogenase
MRTTKKTALITGATSGIGYELAKLFAKDKYNLVLVSRDKTQLAKTAIEMQSLGSKEVHVIAQDLSLDGAGQKVYNKTKELGLYIDVLINDAGVGEHGTFAETDLGKETGIIHLNIISLVHLTKVYLREMLAHKGGRILQLGSMASYQPTPTLAVYAATKAFVRSFSDAIAFELKDSNVSITSLFPNATATDFFRKAHMEHTRAANENPDDPAVVAKIGYDALMKGEQHAYGPGVKKQAVMGSVLPNKAVAAMANELMKPSKKGINPEVKKKARKATAQ